MKSMKFHVIETMKLHDQRGRLSVQKKRRSPLLISRIRDQWDRVSLQEKTVTIAHLTHS